MTLTLIFPVEAINLTVWFVNYKYFLSNINKISNMTQFISASEVKKHNTRKSVWMVIRNEVYDVTAFLNEHPGGEDPLLDAAGQDATIAFEDVGHSADARTMLKKYKVGTLAPGEGCSRLKWALLALGVAIIAGIVYKKYASGA